MTLPERVVGMAEVLMLIQNKSREKRTSWRGRWMKLEKAKVLRYR